MKALLTGSRGTVGSALAALLRGRGHEVVGWDRAHVPLDAYAVMEAYVRGVAPDVLFHLAIPSTPTGRDGEAALVHHHWTGELAWICRQLGVRLVFASTVMVFSDRARGPFTPESEPDAPGGYGRDKREAEARAIAQEPRARVVRLGWQIGDAPGSNQMVDFAERRMAEAGAVRASARFYPACAFLEDTAAALLRAAELPPGVYLADSNQGWTFPEILRALAARLGAAWRVEETDDFAQDQRMIDARLGMPSLRSRLPSLRPL